MTTRTERLAEAILADRNRPTAERTDIAKCFMCGTGMMYRGTRFCSDRCRDFYVSGEPGFEQDWLRPQPVNIMKATRQGFMINCAHCRKEFESLGLRCCSTGCERSYSERDANLAVMAEVGIEPSAKRSCVECGGHIPTWRNGRKVSVKMRFCGAKCQQRHARARTRVLSAETVKKPLVNGPLFVGNSPPMRPIGMAATSVVLST